MKHSQTSNKEFSLDPRLYPIDETQFSHTRTTTTTSDFNNLSLNNELNGSTVNNDTETVYNSDGN